MFKRWLLLSIVIVNVIFSAPRPESIKVIAFDLHGVLLKRCKSMVTSLWDVVANCNNKFDCIITGLNPLFWIKTYKLKSQHYPCEKVLSELSDYSAVKNNYDALFHACNDYCPQSENVNLVQKLKNTGIKLVLASNIGRQSYEYEKNNPVLAPIFSLFDYLHFTHMNDNVSKPSEQYFISLRQAVNKQFNITNNTEILFIDDSNENVQEAQKASTKHSLNIKAIHYTSPEQLQKLLVDWKYLPSIETKIDGVTQPTQLPAEAQQPAIAQPKPIIIDFYATWCGPCQALAPIMEELERQYGDKYEFRKIDVDQNKQLAAKYKVTAMPTIIFERDGVILYKHLGFAEKAELEALIKKYLKTQ